MIINGRKIADEILQGVKNEVANLPFVPVFCDVVVGDDPVSLSYVNMKGKTAARVGIKFHIVQLPGNASNERALGEIQKLNALLDLCGLIIQLPLPLGLDKKTALNAIDPRVDVDCLGSQNSARFYSGQQGALVPPTAAAVMEIMDRLEVDLVGKRVVIVGQGDLVGKPVRFLFEQRGISPTVADKATEDLGSLTKTADVVISATGRPGLIKSDILKEGSIVIDAGTAESEGGIVGDADFESVSLVARALSPVPGGVGPVTVAMLLKNVLLVAQRKAGNHV